MKEWREKGWRERKNVVVAGRSGVCCCGVRQTGPAAGTDPLFLQQRAVRGGGDAASKLWTRRDGFRELATGRCWSVELSMPEGRRREARLDV